MMPTLSLQYVLVNNPLIYMITTNLRTFIDTAVQNIRIAFSVA